MVKTGIYKGKKVKLYFPMKSSKKEKKKMVYVLNKKTGNVNVVHFGQAGASDYTIHKDPKRRNRFRARHGCDPVSKLDRNSPKYFSCEVLWPKGPIKVRASKNKRGTIRRRL